MNPIMSNVRRGVCSLQRLVRPNRHCVFRYSFLAPSGSTSVSESALTMSLHTPEALSLATSPAAFVVRTISSIRTRSPSIRVKLPLNGRPYSSTPRNVPSLWNSIRSLPSVLCQLPIAVSCFFDLQPRMTIKHRRKATRYKTTRLSGAYGGVVFMFVQRPNDPKLSDGGAWRGSCVVERSGGIRARVKGGSDETGPS